VAGVDVVIPNYNYGRYLQACADSVLAQDVDELRLLIVDNGSSDDSASIAMRIAARDPRVELLLRPANLGPHASFNAGIDWAGSDYFALLFADDFLVPGALRRAIGIMERDPTIAFTYGRDVAVSGDAPIPAVPPQPDPPLYQVEEGVAFIERFCRLGVFQLPGPSIVARTDAQKRAGHYETVLPHSDDYHMWLKLALFGRVAELDCIQAGIRSHGENRSRELRARQLLHIRHTADAAEYFFAHEGRALAGCDRLRRLAHRGIAERAYWSAVSHGLRGAPGVLELFRMAIALRSRTAILPPLGYLLRRPDTVRRIRSMLRLARHDGAARARVV
jgi:glycosyltransferase involved in cell wall biosynthesis